MKLGGKIRQIRNRLKRRLRGVRFGQTWQLILILIPLLFITATFLRLDHLKMVELRNAVLEADIAENDDLIAQRLEELRKFTNSHIVINITENNGKQELNFGTGPFYLEHQYLRAAQAAIEEEANKIADDDNPNGNIYAAATGVCQPQAIANGWAWNNPNYLECVTNELAKYPEAANFEEYAAAKIPPTELYQHNYASPIWAWSWAGIAILLSLILIVIIVVRIIIWLVLRVSLLILKKQEKI